METDATLADDEVAPIATAESCDYPRSPTPFSFWENLTLSDSSEIARALKLIARRFAQLVFTRESIDHSLGDGILETMAFYERLDPSAPQLFYPRPACVPKVCVSYPHALSAGEVFDITFRSDFTPLYDPFRAEFAGYEENRTAHARIWKHAPGTSKGCVIAIHGWFMGDQRINALALVPGFFFRLGLDVVVFELPYHGRRAPGGSDNSVALFPSMHVARTNEAVAQAIHDLRALRWWLNEQYGLPVGVAGMSLGGYMAALWASLDELAFVVPMVPMVSMDELGWRVVEDIKSKACASELDFWNTIDRTRLAQIFAIHSPLRYRPRVPKERRMIIAGTGDDIVPAEQPQALWAHWDKPRMHWFTGGHLSELSGSSAFQEVHRFLHDLDLAYAEMLDVKSA